jgi:ABC-type Fe3+ transport system permease subunit
LPSWWGWAGCILASMFAWQLSPLAHRRCSSTSARALNWLTMAPLAGPGVVTAAGGAAWAQPHRPGSTQAPQAPTLCRHAARHGFRGGRRFCSGCSSRL